jgi:hypothetical protein
VSLILDALKKLERDKEAREPGVIVVGAVPWQGVRAPRTWLRLAGGLLAVAVLALAAWWLAAIRTPTARTPAAAASRSPAPAGSSAAATGAGGPLNDRQAPVVPPPPPAPRQLVIPGSADSPVVEPAARPDADLRLNAITERDGQPVALIDGRLVREGDRIDGIHVLHIGAAEVEVEFRGRRRTLRF